MSCTDARELMLTAERPDLEGSTTSDLALHIQRCPACRALAADLIRAEHALGRALEAARPRRHTAEVVRFAARVARQRMAHERRWWRPLPAAAAAIAAGILLVRITIHEAGPVTQPEPRAVAARGVEVTAPPGRSVAVLRADDRHVLVIWFF